MQSLKQVAQAARFDAMQPQAVSERHALAAALTAAANDPEQIVLSVADNTHRWSGYHGYPSLCYSGYDSQARPGVYWDRMHGDVHTPGWYIRQVAYDQHCRKWERSFNCTVDDFGDLVEVQPC